MMMGRVRGKSSRQAIDAVNRFEALLIPKAIDMARETRCELMSIFLIFHATHLSIRRNFLFWLQPI